jgi:hypothetical protein
VLDTESSIVLLIQILDSRFRGNDRKILIPVIPIPVFIRVNFRGNNSLWYELEQCLIAESIRSVY